MKNIYTILQREKCYVQVTWRISRKHFVIKQVEWSLQVQMTKDKLIEYGVLQEVRVIPTGVVVPPKEPDVC